MRLERLDSVDSEKQRTDALIRTYVFKMLQQDGTFCVAVFLLSIPKFIIYLIIYLIYNISNLL